MHALSAVQAGAGGFIAAAGAFQLGLPELTAYRCRFDRGAYDDDCFGQFGVDFPPRLLQAVAKRKAEFLAGRLAARMALGAIGLPDMQVATRADRAPVWPAQVVGSISHAAGEAWCCVAPATQVEALGIDLEQDVRPQVAQEIAPSIVSPAELRVLRGLELSPERCLTLAFSMKESLYKALYPQVGRFFDFSEVEIVGVDTARQQITLCLLSDLSGRWLRGAVLDGHYRLFPSSLLTCVAVYHSS
ncbi:putative 4'-phosphopantetheinyl transferase [Janthinobacterium sp. HH01]|uniref:4'-phosphopantetheinyl transferase family protein n=1 Tax=Janthinobacterium sp. HH01 TaxID=1198452 RepID=UPI0002AEC884|nr:4'-phosphopantetheinyl transferase superfamily protein [Janthinobacterium sp. HH01]ELX07968.1 putative 4'-phosphopantetheinyl transferase [Janthinobacterium sp. HH01]